MHACRSEMRLCGWQRRVQHSSKRRRPLCAAKRRRRRPPATTCAPWCPALHTSILPYTCFVLVQWQRVTRCLLLAWFRHQSCSSS